MATPSIHLTACLVFTAGLISACASSEERHAFDEWTRVRDAGHSSASGGQDDLTDGAYAPGEDPHAQDFGPDADLDDYLAYAALHNPGLEAAFHRWKAALERIPQVRSLPDPRFNYRYFIENVETRVGPQRQRFGVAQTFPAFGTLEARAGVAYEEACRTRARYESAKLQLFYRVTRTYYEYYYLARSIAVIGENRELVKYLEQVARARFTSATAGHPEVIRAQVELGKLDDRHRSLEDLRGAVAARLNAALGRFHGAPIPWPNEVPHTPIPIDEAALFAALARTNPELQALRHQIAREQKSIHLARKAYYPDVTLGVDYVETGEALAGGVPDSGKDAVAAGFSINLPLWREKYDAGVREGLARFGAATQARVDRDHLLQAELSSAWYHFNDAERKIRLYRDTLVPKARQSIKATEASFRAGTSSFTDLIDAERLLLEFQLEYERALTHRQTRLAELEMLIGADISVATLATDDKTHLKGADEP